MKIFNWINPKPKARVTLELNADGWYIVRAYGQYLTETLTKDKGKAEIFFATVIEQIKKGNKLNYVVIKEATITYKEEIKTAEVKEIAKQHKFFGSVKPHKGQTVWQFNIDTKQITPATFQEVNFVATGPASKRGVHKKLVIQPNCIYNVALNMENAKRKFINRIKKGFK